MNRLKWLDVSKGITMILIVLGHVFKSGYVHNIVYYFHVPCFFFLSGITVKEEFSLKRIGSDAKRILIPYFIFGIVSIAVYGVLGTFASARLDDGETLSVWQNVLRLICCSSILPFNAPLYFLPCLFVTKLWHQLMCRINKNRTVQFCLSAVGALIGFIYTHLARYYLPFSFELMLKMYPFFLLGRILSGYLSDIAEKKTLRKWLWLCGSVLLLLTVVSGIIAPSVNYTNNNIPIPGLFYLIASMGIGGIYCFAVCFQNIKWLSYLGERTMSVLTMHKFPIVFFQVCGPFAVMLSNPDSLKSFALGGIPVTVLSVALCLAVGYIIELYFPFMLGKKKYNNVYLPEL